MKYWITLENYYLPGELEQRSAGSSITTTNGDITRAWTTSTGRRLLRTRIGHSQTEGKHQTKNHRTKTPPASAINRSLNFKPDKSDTL